MKNKSILSLLTLVMSAMMLTTSCEDMLTPDLDRYAETDQYGKDSIYSALGVLRSIQNVAERTVLLGESRGDLVTAGAYTTDSISNLINFGETDNGSSALLNVADYYHVINSCNFYLANVDTTTTQNNVSIMKREWAQIHAMRAWAYIQLVRLYGEVPFVTTPVTSTDEAERLQHNAPKVNANTLAAMLVDAGLQRALEVQQEFGMPDYGQFTGGGGSYKAEANLFPVQIVLGDAYLMNNQYAEAAAAYYDYFLNQAKANPSVQSIRHNAGSIITNEGGVESKLVASGDLYNTVTENGINNGQVISSSTGAQTSADGYVFHSLLNTTGFRMEKGSLNADERNLQMMPSQQFLSLARAQHYNKFSVDGDVMVREEYEGGDGRRLAWAPEANFRNGNKQNLIAKYAYSSDQGNSDRGSRIMFTHFSVNYQIPFYRTTQVLLRFAEAINRLGYPQLAFGILKDGLYTENLPSLVTLDLASNATITNPIMDTEADTVIRIDTIPCIVVGKLVNDGLSVTVSTASDSTKVVYTNGTDTIYVGDLIMTEDYKGFGDNEHPRVANIILSDIPEQVQAQWYDVNDKLDPSAITGGMYYLSLDELVAMKDVPFLDFESNASIWSDATLLEEYRSYGVHARGCGNVAGIMDTTYTYARMVAEKVAEKYARANGLSYEEQQAYAGTLYSGDTLLVDNKEDIIDAVENLIVDESALETCFEGHRFTDLIRVAGHKTDAGINGAEWLAWKVARRDKNYTDPAADVDTELYSKLQSKSNWYLPMP